MNDNFVVCLYDKIIFNATQRFNTFLYIYSKIFSLLCSKNQTNIIEHEKRNGIN